MGRASFVHHIPPDFPNRTNFVIARVCAFARPSEAFGGAHDENSSKHDGYHIN